MTNKTKDPIEQVPPAVLAEAIRLWVKHMARELARQERERAKTTKRTE